MTKVPDWMKPKLDMHAQIRNELGDLYVNKNIPYGDAFAKGLNKHGLTAYTLEMENRLSRLEALVGNPEIISTESIQETIMDMANYSIIALTELRLASRVEPTASPASEDKKKKKKKSKKGKEAAPTEESTEPSTDKPSIPPEFEGMTKRQLGELAEALGITGLPKKPNREKVIAQIMACSKKAIKEAVKKLAAKEEDNAQANSGEENPEA
jgi:hypothetical protein